MKRIDPRMDVEDFPVATPMRPLQCGFAFEHDWTRGRRARPDRYKNHRRKAAKTIVRSES